MHNIQLKSLFHTHRHKQLVPIDGSLLHTLSYIKLKNCKLVDSKGNEFAFCKHNKMYHVINEIGNIANESRGKPNVETFAKCNATTLDSANTNIQLN